MKFRGGLTLVALALAACAPNGPSQDAEFVALAARYIEELLERYPETATALGDHRYDGRFGDYTARGVEAGIAWNRGFLENLEAIDPARLSSGNAVDLEILGNHLRFGIWSAEVLREHEWNPLRYGVGDALYSLLARSSLRSRSGSPVSASDCWACRP